MEPKDQYHRYSLTDIERYLQGRLSAAEMHAMEKAALQDPLLADALEGFSDADLVTAHTDLDDIRKQLLSEEKHRVIPFVPRRTYNWRIAAAIIFIAAGVGSWLLFFNNNKQSSQSLALTKDATVQEDSIKPSMAAIAKPDSTGIAAVTARAKTRRKNTAAAIHEQEKIEEIQNKEAALALREQAPAITQQNTRDFPVKISAKSPYPVGTTFYEITGRVTDSLHLPIAAATVENLDFKVRVTTNKNGEFTTYGIDSNANRIVVKAVGFEQVADTISVYNRNNVAILMKPSAAELNDIVTVQGIGKKPLSGNPPPEKLNNFKRQPPLTYELSGRVAGVAIQSRKETTVKIRGLNSFGTKDSANANNITGLPPEPAGGWDSLSQNMRNIAKREKLELPANTVTVKASLALNRKGIARKVSILDLSIESLKPAIEEGLKKVSFWQVNGKKQTGTITVNFHF